MAIAAAAAMLLILYFFSLPRRLFDRPLSTVVTDREGHLLGARIAADGQWRFPASDTLPAKFKACLVEFEDRWFYYHPGVNPVAMVRAARQNLRAGRVVSGGSTITMQTVRLARGKRRTVWEKMAETVLATRLELQYSKERILALYASAAPFGGNVVGIEAAAWRYFGHSPAELSWAEAATLAVLPNAPSTLNPAKGREALEAKRNRLLKRLSDRGIIDFTTYQSAISEPLPDRPQALPRVAPHLVAWLNKTDPGRRCVTTIDRGVQTRVENLLERRGEELSRRGVRNLAAVVIDLETNQVAAYCGNIGFDSGTSANQVDILRAPRSTGSILKPLLYCAALQEGTILPRTLEPDVPVNINGFAPSNFNMQFDGAVPAGEAIARSLNVPSVNMLREYGVPKFHAFLRQAHLTTLTRPASHYGLSLILGGAEATLWDVAAAYASMARTLRGDPATAPQIVLYRDGRPEEPARIKTPFTRAGVWQTFDAIKEVNRPEEIDWRDIPSMQRVAWKTGTSYGLRDGWAVGATRRWVVAVWAGNSSGEASPSLTGATTAGPVMFDILNLLPAARWFAAPTDEMTQAAVCRQSGHLAGRFCDDADTVLVIPAGLQSDPCPYHIAVTVTPDERYRTYATGDEPCVQRNWFVLPPSWAWYYRRSHPEYRPLPPMKHGSGGIVPMQFLYPQPGAVITLPRQLDGSPGAVTCKVAHDYPGAKLFWHLDGEYAGETTDFHQATLSPPAGRHRLTVVDNRGDAISVAFEVR